MQYFPYRCNLMASKKVDSNSGGLQVLFLILGLLFCLFGFQIMLFPMVSSIALDMLIGILLLVLGLAQIVLAFLSRDWKGFLFVFIAGILSLLLGFVLLAAPYKGVIGLTLLLGIFLLVQGLVKLVMSFKFRPSRNWEWLLFDGLITLLLGGLIIAGWPSDSLWVIGLLFGIDVLFGGLSMLLLSFAMKEK